MCLGMCALCLCVFSLAEVEGCYAVQWPQELVSSVLPIEASKSVHIPVEISLHRWHQNLIGQQNSTE